MPHGEGRNLMGVGHAELAVALGTTRWVAPSMPSRMQPYRSSGAVHLCARPALAVARATAPFIRRGDLAMPAATDPHDLLHDDWQTLLTVVTGRAHRLAAPCQLIDIPRGETMIRRRIRPIAGVLGSVRAPPLGMDLGADEAPVHAHSREGPHGRDPLAALLRS